MFSKVNSILFRLAAVLLMLVLVSTSMVTGRYARYTTTAQMTDSARVAKFSVTETTNMMTEAVAFGAAPGITDYCEIQVRNDSEVAVEYALIIKNSSRNLPLQFVMEEKNPETNAYMPTPPTENVGGVSVHHAFMAPNTTATYRLGAYLPQNVSSEVCGKVDLIEVTMKATQID